MRKPEAAAALTFEGGWLTLDETMKRLGKSISTVERLVTARAIATKLKPVAGRKPMRLYREEDVDRCLNMAEARRLNNTRALAAASPRQPVQLGVVPETISALREVVEEWRNGHTLAITQKLWLTIEEAQTYSGLCRNDLLRLCRDGKVEARKSPGWRIRRASLEAFAG